MSDRRDRLAIVYGTRGPVSGDCHHNHRSLRSAWHCIGRHAGSHDSDRAPFRRDGLGVSRQLTEAEVSFLVTLSLAQEGF